MDLSPFREELLQRRREILENQKPLATSMGDTNTRQGDLADQATGNNEVHIHLKLKQTDAKILQAIEEALQRIEHGTFGTCRDCGKAIPWTRVCIACKEKQKA
jgi:DnaK suppressor protein